MQVLIVGLPNVGKSSIINALRSRGKAAATGNQAGVTRKVTGIIKISEKPDVTIVDTPGVFIPFVPNPETMLKFALTGCIKDSLYDHHTVADYLLYQLNLHDPSVYMSLCRMTQPTNDIECVLQEIAMRTGKLSKGGVADTGKAAEHFLHRYRTGSMGNFVLDNLDDDSVSERLRLEKEAKSQSMVRKEAIAERKKEKK